MYSQQKLKLVNGQKTHFYVRLHLGVVKMGVTLVGVVVTPRTKTKCLISVTFSHSQQEIKLVNGQKTHFYVRLHLGVVKMGVTLVGVVVTPRTKTKCLILVTFSHSQQKLKLVDGQKTHFYVRLHLGVVKMGVTLVGVVVVFPPTFSVYFFRSI